MIDEPFELPVTYQGKELLFTATLRQTGFTHRFEVNVHGDEVFFEKDEEGAYRAIAIEGVNPDNVDKGLVQAVAEAIEEVLR